MFRKKSGFVLWFTGLSQSGKTTIARGVKGILEANDINVVHLDGDEFRRDLCHDLGFSQKDRDENIRRAIYVAKVLSRAGVWVIASFISPYQHHRQAARTVIGDNFIEIYCDCSLIACEARDTKGLYRGARSGDIASFTGISDLYDTPINPELILDTQEESPGQSINTVMGYLIDRDFIL